MKRLKPPWKESDLGSDAARARNRPARSAARCAGRGEYGKTLEPQSCCEGPALHREAERDTTGSFYTVSPRYIRGSATACKGTVFCAATLLRYSISPC